MQGFCLQCGELKGIHPESKVCGTCRKANLNHVLDKLREERNDLLQTLGKVLSCAKFDHDKWSTEYAKAQAVYIDMTARVDKFGV